MLASTIDPRKSYLELSRRLYEIFPDRDRSDIDPDRDFESRATFKATAKIQKNACFSFFVNKVMEVAWDHDSRQVEEMIEHYKNEAEESELMIQGLTQALDFMSE